MIADKIPEPSNFSLRPIYIIGAGGIVNDAHLPAYNLAEYNVQGVYDINQERALATAKKFSIPRTFTSLEELVAEAEKDAVFDVAVPASSIMDVLQVLPRRAPVLIQKPMGSDLAEAKKILTVTRAKEHIAAVNFQLRYSPAVQSARQMIKKGLLGDLYDIEVNVNVYTPWHLWDFLFQSPRVEILYHSIHYIDLVRSFFGNPESIYAKTVKHPKMSQLASVRSTVIMDYGNMKMVNIRTNHGHQFGTHHQQSYIKFEGTTGAIRINLGLLMNYPHGESDKFEYIHLDDAGVGKWRSMDIQGSWFPHAFMSSMNELMIAVNAGRKPDHSVEDCIYTMACVEAAYQSSEAGGVPLKDIFQAAL